MRGIKAAFLICLTILSSFLLGYSKNPLKPSDNSDRTKNAEKREIIQVDSFKLNITVPEKWEIPDSGENKNVIIKERQPMGLIEVVGYYRDQPERGALPNHSEITSSQDAASGIGNGKLYILKQSGTSASGDSGEQLEIRVLIPVENQDLAISIALKTSKSSTDSDIKDFK